MLAPPWSRRRRHAGWPAADRERRLAPGRPWGRCEVAGEPEKQDDRATV